MAAWTAAGVRAASPDIGGRLALTPQCGDAPQPTAEQTEGPFFKPGTPERRDLSADARGGRPILVGGLVVDARCRPLSDSLIELWHADDAGRYDNGGFRLRGHQRTDPQGRWWFTTIVPGGYPGRTRHYHVKVRRPGGRMLTTQLYFPDEPLNRRDALFDARLELKVLSGTDGMFARYDFVV
jgi:protocatechuate 3,4-dioxygenase beta subunit